MSPVCSDLYFGATARLGKESNWIKTVYFVPRQPPNPAGLLGAGKTPEDWGPFFEHRRTVVDERFSTDSP
jgi:hypothetical protein